MRQFNPVLAGILSTTLLIGGCGGGSGGGSATPATQPTSQAPAGPAAGVLSGIVTDTATGQPLSGATVTATGATLTGAAGSVSATTDAQGVYQLNLPGGDYTLTISYAGYDAQTKSVSVNGDGMANSDLYWRATRAYTDQPDDVTGFQVHALYVIPSDLTDAQHDLNQSISRSLNAANGWFAQQANGQQIRLDTYQGRPDVTFVRLNLTDAQIHDSADQMATIAQALAGQGFNAPEKLYAVYYAGRAISSCGAAYRPQAGATGANQHYAVEFLSGSSTGGHDCSLDRFTQQINQMGMQEYGMLHELIHGMGFGNSCSPHATADGAHVSDSPTDLMYAGDQPWTPQVLDFGRDDYYSTGSTTCPDLANSVFLTKVSNPQVPAGWY